MAEIIGYIPGPMRIVRLIVNPASGASRGRTRGASDREIGRFRAAIEEAGIRFESASSTGPGSAAELAAAAAREGVSDVVAAGGDGTICEVASGLFAAGTGSIPRLGLWPRGTANVLAGELDCPRAAEPAARIVIDARTRPIRPGVLEEESTGRTRIFFLMAGVGLDADVVARVRPGLKGLFGKAAFWWAGLTVPWRPESFQVEAGGRTYPATFLCVGRSSRYGGGFSVTPGASLDRPEFEVAIVDVSSRARMAALAGRAFGGGGLEPHPPEVTFVRATAVRASGAPVRVQADGDLSGTLPARFSLSARPLEVIVPGSTPPRR